MKKTGKAYINLTVTTRNRDGSETRVRAQHVATFNAQGDAAIAARALNEAGAPGFKYEVSGAKIEPFDFCKQ